MIRVFKLSGWEKYSTPILSWQLTKLSYDDFPFSVIIKHNYMDFFPKEEIFETLRLTSGNVVAVGYKTKVKRPKSWNYTSRDSELETVPAIYFSKKSDIVMFKLAYSEIISEYNDGEEKPGISYINIDIEKLKELINSDEHSSKKRWKY